MSDQLIDRLTAARPETPRYEPDPQLVDQIVTSAPPQRRFVTPLRLASVAAVAAVLVAVLLVAPRDAPVEAPRRVASVAMQPIVDATSAALDSGRAHVVHSSHTDRAALPHDSGADFVVEFNGDNRSMFGTVDPGDGRSSAFPIANMVVDGRFYLQDGVRWVEDTAANLSGGDIFSVDPRNFLAGVAQAAQFEQVGREEIGGVATRHLRATKLDSIPDFNLGLGPRGDENKLTAFDLWVDGDDVVRGLLVETSQRQESYTGARTLFVVGPDGTTRKVLDPDTVGEPKIVTITSSYKVEFTDLGSDVVITAPVGAPKVAGKG